jgi:hypothetical protein
VVIDNTSPFPSVSTSYGAGFVDHQNEGSLAHANIESFRSSQDANVFSVWATDPYVRGAEPIDYLLGSANLTTRAYGYQGSLSATGATTVTGFASLAYPFPQVLLAPITGALHYAAGVATNVPGPDFDTLLASLTMANPGGNGTASSNALSTFAGPFTARYSDEFGAPLPSLSTVNSNTVVVDNTFPTVTPQSLTLLPSTNIPLGGTMVTGSYRVVADARDLGASPSGLDDRPTYSWDFGNDSSVEIGPTPMNSGAGNAFYADFNVLNSYTNGPAKLTIEVTDRAGNKPTSTVIFTLNTSTFTINFTVPSAWAGKPMWIHARLGGSGGGTGPYDYHRSVTIGAGGAGQLVLNALNTATPVALPLAPNNITQFSVKAMPYSLRVNGAFTGTFDKVGNAGTLRFGDANGDNLVDILDYAFYAVQYNTAETPAPVGLADGALPNGDGVLLPLASRRADFSGNGLVFTEDFTFFFPFPAIGDPLSGGPGGFRFMPKSEITVKEAINAGIPSRIVDMMDANQNGIITLAEIDAYMQKSKRR